MATLKTEGGGVKQDLGTVSERELTVAKVLSLLLVVEDLDRVTGGLGKSGKKSLRDSLGLLGLGALDEGEVGDENGLPLGKLEVTGVGKVGNEGGKVSGEVGLGLETLLTEGLVDLLEGVLLADVNKGRGVGAVTLNVTNLTEGLDGTLNDTTGLGVGKGGLDLDQTGEELAEERTNSALVVDELGHVVNDDGDLTLGGGGALVETTRKKGHHKGEGGAVDLLNEGGGGQELDGLGDLLDGVDERADEGGDETLDILVGDEDTELVSEAREAFWTSVLVSQMTSDMTGMISGMRAARRSGQAWTISSRRVMHPILTCHLPAVRACSRMTLSIC